MVATPLEPQAVSERIDQLSSAELRYSYSLIKFTWAALVYGVEVKKSWQPMLK